MWWNEGTSFHALYWHYKLVAMKTCSFKFFFLTIMFSLSCNTFPSLNFLYQEYFGNTAYLCKLVSPMTKLTDQIVSQESWIYTYCLADFESDLFLVELKYSAQMIKQGFRQYGPVQANWPELVGSAVMVQWHRAGTVGDVTSLKLPALADVTWSHPETSNPA